MCLAVCTYIPLSYLTSKESEVKVYQWYNSTAISAQECIKGALYSSYKASQDIVCFALKEILWSLN